MANARTQMKTHHILPKIQGVETLPEEPEKCASTQVKHQRYQTYQTREQNGHSKKFRNKEKGRSDRVLGKICGFNKAKTSAAFLLEDGRKAIIHYKNITFMSVTEGNVDQALPLGSEVEVVYEGRQPNGFEKWKCIGIIKK